MAKKTLSFKDYCSIYMERHAKKHKKSWVEDQRRIDKYLIPAFGAVRLDAITRSDIAKFHGSIGKQYPYGANRLIEQLSKMYQLAVLWGYVPENYANPTKGIQSFKEEKRDRWVKPDELPNVAKAINKEKNFYGKNALWLYLLLGVRRDELLKAKWDDIDWDRKELKIPETKAGRIHYVPLSAPALSILQELPEQKGNPYILPGEKPGHHLVNIEKIWQRVRKAAGVEDVRLHDLRRTLGSWLAQSGNSLHLIGRVLNHSNQSTTAIYARFAQDNVRAALEAHGNKIISIAGKQAPVKILPKTRKRKAK
jgi:integrase